MIAVISKPIKSPIKGLDVANKIDSAVLLPRLLKDCPIMSMAKRNTNSDRAMVMLLFMVLAVFSFINLF